MKTENPTAAFFELLKNDPELRQAYHDNIAMSFKDNYRWYMETVGEHSPTSEQIHAIANNAAEYFLNLLLK